MRGIKVFDEISTVKLSEKASDSDKITNSSKAADNSILLSDVT